MPDICKCLNKKCPKRKTCYRFTAKADEYQSYAHFNYGEDTECYWEIITPKKYQKKMDKIIKKGKPVAETFDEMLKEAGKYEVKA